MAYILYDIRFNKMNIVLQMSALYHRNIGCYNDAIEEYKESLKSIDNIDNKRYLIVKFINIILKKDYYNMYVLCCFKMGRIIICLF